MNVAVPTHQLEAGTLPRICAASGRPADRSIRLTSTRRRAWFWLASFVGPLAFLLSWLVARDRRVGRVPVTAAVRTRYLTWLWVSRVVLGAGLLLAIDLGVRGLLAVLVISALSRLLARRAAVGLRHRAGSTHVIISGVHPRFVAAVTGAAAPASPLLV